MARDTTAILMKGIDLEALIRTNPELFNLKSYNLHDKIELLDRDPKFYSTLIDVTTFAPNEKVTTLLTLKKTSITKLIKLSNEELKRVPGGQYGKLVLKDFSYIRAERFSDMNKEDQSEIFLSQPQWVLDNVAEKPKFTTVLLTSVAHRSPKFIDDHFDDFKTIKTNQWFWNSMIKFDPVKYKALFLKSTHTISSKTEVRAVFHKHPSLIRDLTPDMVQDLKLTGKELVILINTIMKDQPKAFAGWKMSAEMTEALHMDLTAEMLNGKSKMSNRFRTAMNQVLKPEEEVEEEVE